MERQIVLSEKEYDNLLMYKRMAEGRCSCVLEDAMPFVCGAVCILLILYNYA